MATIFGVSIPDVSRHIKNFVDAGELDDSVVAEFARTAPDGKSCQTKHYGLDEAMHRSHVPSAGEPPTTEHERKNLAHAKDLIAGYWDAED